jgi:polyhydroxyalkanoate synthesis regulator phasin
VRQAFASRHAGDDETPVRLSPARVDAAAAPVAPAWSTEIASLRAEIDQLRETVNALSNQLQDLKSALGV